MAKLLLFDVDLTMLTTGGADRRALDSAFEELYGIPEAFANVSFAGRMDLAIVGGAFRKFGIDQHRDPSAMSRFRDAYVARLESILTPWSQGRQFPGVGALLETLSAREDAHLGLVTGNFREAAFLKLRKYGLDGFFAEGGFGEDSEERHQVVALAISRCQAARWASYTKEDIYVIGDSPADVLGGKANGVRTVAVATGRSSADELRTYGPTHIFPDLSDTLAFLDRVMGDGEGLGKQR